MTAALVADYYGETNNAINYGSIYAFKALGGSFAGGVAALIMTGTLYGTAHFHWAFGFFFGALNRRPGRADRWVPVQAPDRRADAGRGARARGRGGEEVEACDCLSPRQAAPLTAANEQTWL